MKLLNLNYHSYFEPDLAFYDDRLSEKGQQIDSYQKFSEAGFSDNEARDLVASGYEVLTDELVIDRYYGGQIMRYDLRTRFSLKRFKQEFGIQPNRLPLHAVTSIAELFALLEKLQRAHNRPLLFRGQTGHYSLKRTVPNPTFVNSMIGETSLLPSVWRRVLKHRANVRHQFRDLSMFEWSKIIYHLFDLQTVYEQEEMAGFMFGIDDPDDIPNEPALLPLRDFHDHRQAFLREYCLGGGTSFMTLLQHYGLFSPVLDLTTDPEVALFFATQKFTRQGPSCRYRFNGTNHRQAIIYALFQDPNETHLYQRTEMLNKLDPERPKRQSCVVMPTNEYAMNLAGDFLVAAIKLDFEMTAPGRFTVGDLFPSDDVDLMLAALKHLPSGPMRENLTDFAIAQ